MPQLGREFEAMCPPLLTGLQLNDMQMGGTLSVKWGLIPLFLPASRAAFSEPVLVADSCEVLMERAGQRSAGCLETAAALGLRWQMGPQNTHHRSGICWPPCSRPGSFQSPKDWGFCREHVTLSRGSSLGLSCLTSE